MKYIMIAALLLASCGGGGSDPAPVDPVTPPTGGGTTTPPPTSNPSPPPSAPEIKVEVDGTATFFRDVTVTVTGASGEWTYEVSAGNVEETDTGLRIWSDGRVGMQSVIIRDGEYEEEFFFDIEDDPICENVLTNTIYKQDCLGLTVGPIAQSQIYYGEDDTHVVDIEVVVVRNDSTSETCSTRLDSCWIDASLPKDHEDYITATESIDKMNEFMQRSNIYIRLVLIDVVWNRFQGVGGVVSARYNYEVDWLFGWGPAGGNLGEANMQTSFSSYERAKRFAANTSGWTTWMHEFGHTLGLGHGIWGQTDWRLESDNDQFELGSIFPRFGHGWSNSNGACGSYGSFMSYNSPGDLLATNSTQRCDEIYPDNTALWSGRWGDYAGSRQQSDEAYAINRVRYRASLVHNEHLYEEQ